jgi:phage host-nuclease inhibitor protein Gam
MNDTPPSTTKITPSKKRFLITVVAGLGIIIIGIMAVRIMTPERSVAAYCKVYKEENTKLMSAKGSTYAVAVFSHRSSNPADFAAAFSKLEQVAPDEIRPDVKTLKQIFQKIDADPSQAISASLSGISAEASVKAWTNEQCKD